MKTFEVSRLSEGNKIFPTQLTIIPIGVSIKKPGIFSYDETTIPFKHITYVNINTPLIGFSSIEFGTEGTPVKINGFTSKEVREIKILISNKI